MRWKLFIILGLAFLGAIGFAAYRVTSSDAYIVRTRAMRIQEGMTRNQVHAIMADCAAPETKSKDGVIRVDCWSFDGHRYELVVVYEATRHDTVPRTSGIVHAVQLCGTIQSDFDRLLEYLGYPEVYIWSPY